MKDVKIISSHKYYRFHYNCNFLTFKNFPNCDCDVRLKLNNLIGTLIHLIEFEGQIITGIIFPSELQSLAHYL